MRKRWLVLGLVLCGALSLLLLATELILDHLVTRYVDNARALTLTQQHLQIHRASADPQLVYELTPGAALVRDGIEYRINGQGYRDNEFPAPGPKSPGEYRIVVIGDSVAWGWGVSMEDAWPNALEQALAQARPEQPVRIYNLAVNGYSTAQEVRTLETVGLAYEPDLVILNYSLNDPTVEDGGMWMYFKPIDRYETGYRAKILFAGLRGWVMQLVGQASVLPRGNPWDSTWMIHEALYSNVEDGFTKLASLRSRHAGLNILVIVTPMFDFRKDEPYPWAHVHQKIADSCRYHGFDYLDTQPYFASVDSKSVSVDVIHPNAEGHRILRDALLQTLRNNYLRDEVRSVRPDRDAAIPVR